MPHTTLQNKHQTTPTPHKKKHYINQENPTKLIAAYTDTLNLQKLGTAKTTPKTEKQPAHPPQLLLKPYIYGYHNKIRSSKKIAKKPQKTPK